MTVGTWILVALFGGLGAVARFVVDGLVGSRRRAGAFPLGTFVVNLSGAALLGGLVGAGVGGNALIVVGTAMLGAYTTFSTWMFETHRLAEDDQLPVAAANLFGSLLIGFAAAAAGHAVGAAL